MPLAQVTLTLQLDRLSSFDLLCFVARTNSSIPSVKPIEGLEICFFVASKDVNWMRKEHAGTTRSYAEA